MVLSLLFLFLVISGSAYGDFPDIPAPSIYNIQTRVDEGDYRLPGNTVPISYEVELEPFFETFTFDGRVSIDIRVVTDSDSITLHSNELSDYDSILIEGVDDGPIEIDSSSLIIDTTDLQFLTIPLGQTIPANTTLTLSMTFTGILNANTRGFYRASYEEDGETKWFATTQFESTSARQAFPCYDEPALKANFTIRLIRSADYHSISNTELAETIDLGEDRFADVYEETVPMSTYLLAFIVSKMSYTERRENQMVYAARDHILDGRGEYALEVGIDTLTAMEEFTGVPYSLSKIFQVAIPNNWFSSGAMENWGLVTYREQRLLYKDGISTASEKQSIASVIAHEYGHQWFGNLVSPLWWKYIWLNEGFATYFENYATSQVDTEMRMMDQFVIRTHQYAMESDSLESSRPMSTNAETPMEISSLFDRVAYDKSGSVIRMMEHILTTDVFKRGLTIYLEEKGFDSAEGIDLWNAMQEAIEEANPELLQGQTVQEIMETWELQAGFPVIFVSRNDGQITISQSRFLLNQATHSYETIWTIPINYATASNPVFTDTNATHWLTTASQEFEDIVVDDDEWIIVNKQETGYYRVNYDEESWQLIINYLNSSNYNNVHILNRAQLVDDAINLARSGRLHYNITLDLLLTLRQETDYIPLYPFFRGLTYLDRFMINTEQYDNFKDYVKEILQAAYETLGTQDTGPHTDKLNRINVLTWLCKYGHEDCLAAMGTQLEAMSAASPDLQTVVYCSGQRDATRGDAKLEFLLDRYLDDEAEDLEKSRILTALGCSTSEDVLNRLLDIALSKEDGYPIGDSSLVTSMFSSVYTQSDVGLRVAFDYIINNFEEMDSVLSQGRVISILTGIADRLTNEEQRLKWTEFVSSLSTTMADRYTFAITSANLIMANNAAWSTVYLEDITNYFAPENNGDDDNGDDGNGDDGSGDDGNGDDGDGDDGNGDDGNGDGGGDGDNGDGDNDNAYVFAISLPLIIITTLSHLLV